MTKHPDIIMNDYGVEQYSRRIMDTSVKMAGNDHVSAIKLWKEFSRQADETKEGGSS